MDALITNQTNQSIESAQRRHDTTRNSMFAGGSKVNQWLSEWAGHEIENKAIVVRTVVGRAIEST